jgi:uncharacterized protein YecT (DUF1311 family)
MMKPIRTTVLAALLAIAPSAAQAQSDPPVDCANAQTQFDLNQCAYQDFERADEALNHIYKQAMKAATEADKEAAEMGEHYVGAVNELKKAQRAWIDYRDGNCAGMSREALGGSMQPMLISGCQMKMTEARTKELGELISALTGN